MLNAECFLSRDGRPLRRAAAVVAQGHIHENASAGSIEAHYQGFSVFTALAALLGRVQGWWPNVKMESLIVERGDGVANDLIGQLTDRLAHQIVALGYFDAGETGGKRARGAAVNIN